MVSDPKIKPVSPESLGLQVAPDWHALAQKCYVPQGVEVPQPETVFELAGVPLLTKKSISLLIAKAKAGKTTVTAWMIAQAILRGVKCLWVDTEQGLYYGSRTQHWILSIAGLSSSQDLAYYDLKIHPPDIRVQIIEALLQSENFDLVVTDGIRDLVYDINSPEEATNTATNLMKWAEQYNCHIVTILHQNKNSEHARGHLGSELVNKAETVVKVSTGEQNEIVVEPEFTRGKPFETFALIRDENGIPSLLNDWVRSAEKTTKPKVLLPTEIAKETHLEIIKKAFNDGEPKRYNELLLSLKNQINSWYGSHIGDTKVRPYIQHYLDEKLLSKSGQTPHTKYFITDC